MFKTQQSYEYLCICVCVCVCYFLQQKVIFRDIQLIWLKPERLQEAGGSEHSCQHLSGTSFETGTCASRWFMG